MEDFPERQQELKEGVGPIFHRIYRIELPVGKDAARRAMNRLQADPNQFSPQWLARFEKNEGDELKLAPGDSYQIHLSGPWNAPVRVRDVTPEGFCLVTLEGHLEVGEIHFRLDEVKGKSYFVVESLARSKDALVDLLYEKIPVVRIAQTGMWKKFCHAVAEEAVRAAGGDPEQAAELPVEVTTEKLDVNSGVWQSA